MTQQLRPITNHAAMGAHAVDSPGDRQPFSAPTRTPRVLLRPADDAPEQLGGAWWPWTSNLTTELHDLVTALTPRLGELARIGFDWNAISVAQRRIDDDDGIHIHGPMAGQPSDTMRLVGSDGTTLTLLVIPADTEPRIAERRMLQAAGRVSDRAESAPGPPP
ncbi:hypothetical protein IU498_30580 [Nocardia beijingensis]|uniref:DUF5994 family protein n=1 Tax=Nocardia beijingensis TaxID=95162 RepID=UPI0018954291|nr:DUF5994 family protein [Nocardia beijingensis]MBF6078978.1 hypothetical protein [Nocardia beijingensis]